MSLRTRKLNLITYISELKDEKFFKEVENYILKKQPKNPNPDFEPFTVDELIERVKKSERDFKEGKFKTQEELEKSSANW